MDIELICLPDEDNPATRLRLGDDAEYSSDSDQASTPSPTEASKLLGWWVLTFCQAQVPTATRPHIHPLTMRYTPTTQRG